MDIRTGRTYSTREEALAAGVPDSDIADVRDGEPRFGPPIQGIGPFKDRLYRRDQKTGNFVRVK